MPRPPNTNSAETWDRIVDAALERLASDDGMRLQISLRSVATAAGLSPGTVSYYFSSKDELLEACLDRYYERLAALTQELFTMAISAETPQALVENSVRALYRFASRERASVALRARTRELNGELPPERQTKVLGPYVAKAASVLQLGAGMAELDARLTVQSLTKLIVSYVLMTDDEMGAVLAGAGTRDDVEDHLVALALRMIPVGPGSTHS